MSYRDKLLNSRMWFSPKEVGILKGWHKHTVIRKCQSGEIPHRKEGRYYKIPLSYILEEWNGGSD